jgi:uncharacterized membrane protein
MPRHRKTKRPAGAHASKQSPLARSQASITAPTRVPLIDALRGFSVCMMIAYHFLFDTTYFGYTHFNMLVDTAWIAWRNTIVSSFLFLAGIGFVLATQHRQRSAWRRNSQIGASALLVSAGSYAIFPASFIYFGVLHFNFVAALLAPWLLRLSRAVLPLALAILAAGFWLHTSSFDPKPLNWLGFAAHKPITEDYVPIIPWLGVLLLGVALGLHWQAHRFKLYPQLQTLDRQCPRWLLWLGRHSLLAYLAHQPILFGCFELLAGKPI